MTKEREQAIWEILGNRYLYHGTQLFPAEVTKLTHRLSALMDAEIAKNIEKHGDNYAVVIHASAPGDPSVGIHSPTETVTIHEPQFFDDQGGLEHRELLRTIFTETFSELWDDNASVTFDDECADCGEIAGKHKPHCPDNPVNIEARLKALQGEK